MKLNENIKIESLVKGSFNPILLEQVEQKELKGYDWAALRYLALEYLQNNSDTFGFDNCPICEMDGYNAIQDNKLYVGNFEGLLFDDDKVLHCFAFSAEGRLIALIETGKTEDEEGNFNWYLMD